MSIYINDFLLVSNTMVTLDALKKLMATKYNIKNLSEVKTIIGWQVTKDMARRIIKINQTAFIKDLVIEEGLTNCNTNVIPMKAKSAIEMSKPNNYNKTNIHTY